MKAAGVSVAVPLAELAAGVQGGEDELEGGAFVLGMQADGDTTAVVGDGDRVVLFVQGDGNAIGVAVEVLIDGVIDDFPDKVMQAELVGGADVHAGTPTDGLEAFEDVDVGFGVGFRIHGGAGHVWNVSLQGRLTQILHPPAYANPRQLALRRQDHHAEKSQKCHLFGSR